MRPHSFVVTAPNRAAPDQVFALLADAPRWPEWAGSTIRHGSWV